MWMRRNHDGRRYCALLPIPPEPTFTERAAGCPRPRRARLLGNATGSITIVSGKDQYNQYIRNFKIASSQLATMQSARIRPSSYPAMPEQSGSSGSRDELRDMLTRGAGATPSHLHPSRISSLDTDARDAPLGLGSNVDVVHRRGPPLATVRSDYASGRAERRFLWLRSSLFLIAFVRACLLHASSVIGVSKRDGMSPFWPRVASRLGLARLACYHEGKSSGKSALTHILESHRQHHCHLHPH